jgi:hypothetical protein
LSIVEIIFSISFFLSKNSLNFEVAFILSSIDKEKEELEKHYNELMKKALAFELSTKSNLISSQMKELEKNLTSVNNKKSNLRKDLEKLVKLIKG